MRSSARTEAACLTDHQMGTSVVLTLDPATTYTFNATFTGADGQTATRSLSVTTASPAAAPLIVTSAGVAAAAASWTVSTNQCATVTGYWAEQDGALTSGIISIPTCQTGFVFQVPSPVSGASYRFVLTFTSTTGGGAQDASSSVFTYP